MSAAASTPRLPTSAPTWSARSKPGIPEDDPRNPATIADNVGDNVGDVAGMGADLFESYVGSMIAPIAFAAFAFAGFAFQEEAFFYPLMIATLGMGASIIGSFLVKPGKGSLAAALHRGHLRRHGRSPSLALRSSLR